MISFQLIITNKKRKRVKIMSVQLIIGRHPSGSNKTRTESITLCYPGHKDGVYLYETNNIPNTDPRITRADKHRHLRKIKIHDKREILAVLIKYHNLPGIAFKVEQLAYLSENPTLKDFMKRIAIQEEGERREQEDEDRFEREQKEREIDAAKKWKIKVANLPEGEAECISRGTGHDKNYNNYWSFVSVLLGHGRTMKIRRDGINHFGRSQNRVIVELEDAEWEKYQELVELSDAAGPHRCLDNFVFRQGSMPTVRGLAKYVDTASPGWIETKRLLRSFKGRRWQEITNEEIMNFLNLFNKCSKKEEHHG